MDNDECQECSNCLVCLMLSKENKKARCDKWDYFVEKYVNGKEKLIGEEIVYSMIKNERK